MALGISTNLLSLNTQKSLNRTQNLQETAMQRLSSGLRINSAKDDAAGLAIGTKMDSQVRGMNVAMRNANDGISMVQTADGALDTISNVFQRMRELAVQASNGTYEDSGAALANLDEEYQALSAEVTRIAGATKFNDQAIIGADAKAYTLQVGANSGETLSVTTVDADSYLAAAGDLTTNANASTAIDALDTALETLNTDRATYGATLNRLDFTIKNLQTASESQTAARSRIMDADFAQETATLARQQVLQQAGIAMLSQANQMPSQVLSLLR